MRELVKIDAVAMLEHRALRWKDDTCFYLLEFFSGRRYGFDPDNDLVKNMKRRIDRCGEAALMQKEWACSDIADLLRPAFASLFDFTTTTFVPVPPSQTRPSPNYDDRVVRLLRGACATSADIRELIVCREEVEPVHFSPERPSAGKLVENFVLGDIGGEPVRERIVVFDDIITSGNHFVACKRFLLGHFPGREVVGVFVARRVLG